MNNETAATSKEDRVIQMGFWKAFSILAGAVLVSIVGTAFTVGAVLNSDHFLLARTVDEVTDLKESKVDKAVYEIQQQHILDDLAEIKDILRQRSVVSTRTLSPPQLQSTPQVTEVNLPTPSQQTSVVIQPSEQKPTPESDNHPQNPLPSLLPQLPIPSPLFERVLEAL